MGIEVQQVNKNFGNFQALQDINLDVPTGQLVALLGPSGSGKTTLLRIIAGLEVPDTGRIYFHGEDTTGQRIQERKVGFVFQHYALFKQMSVFENIAFGLRVRPRHQRLPEKAIKDKVHELLQLVQMEWLADRYPNQLSGGQRQRIALARALAVEPKVLLLDEPFGALDAKVRKELRRWLRHLHDQIHITSIFVTHDQDEALEVADQVVIMNQGRIEQIGTPESVYDHPANLFVYKFLGNVNLFRGRVSDGQIHIGTNVFDVPRGEAKSNDIAVAYARPYELEVDKQCNELTNIEAAIVYIRAIGPIVRLELQRTDNGDLIDVELSKEKYQDQTFQSGEKVFIGLRNPQVFAEDYSI